MEDEVAIEYKRLEERLVYIKKQRKELLQQNNDIYAKLLANKEEMKKEE